MNLDSTNKRILVVADPHQDMATLNKIIKHEDAAVTVCLGDYFDSFVYNTKAAVEATCKFLLKNVVKDNFITLIGNHDVPQLYDNQYASYCSGFSLDKKKLVLRALGSSYAAIRDRFKWYVWIDDFLCTHAGLHPCFLPYNQDLTSLALTGWLDGQVELANHALLTNQSHWFFRAGEGRGGNQKVGGLVWLDADVEALPIEGLSQLYGHTSHHRILQHKDQDGLIDINDCTDIDIDCHLRQYLIIHDKKLQIKNTIDI